MPRKSERQKLLESIMLDPSASAADRIKAAEALDAYLKQRKAYRRHGRVKKMLGIGAKERRSDPRMTGDLATASPERQKEFAAIFDIEAKRGMTARDVRRMELAKNPTPENLVELAAVLRQQAAENGVTGGRDFGKCAICGTTDPAEKAGFETCASCYRKRHGN